jgi:hypothetical protein
MKNRLLKALGYLVGGAAALILVAAAAVYGLSEVRYRKQYAVRVPPVAIPTDSVALARGEHLVRSFGGCMGRISPARSSRTIPHSAACTRQI